MKRRISPYPFIVFKTTLMVDDFLIVQMGNPNLAGDYCWVEFYLKAENLTYLFMFMASSVIGNYCRNLDLITIETRRLSKKVLLKQGYYNYVFAHADQKGHQHRPYRRYALAN